MANASRFSAKSGSSDIGGAHTGAITGAFTASSAFLSSACPPPALAAISNAEVVVAFKSLAKRDSITKAKGLESLIAYAKARPYSETSKERWANVVEDAVLHAWIDIFPRLSIDNARLVRILCHKLQLEFLKSARKRYDKKLRLIAGPWLMGTFDKDTAVSRAALDSVGFFLDTDDKQRLLWRACLKEIVDFANEAMHETAKTLSDERFVSTEDAQAKYFRVMGGILFLLSGLLKHQPPDATETLRNLLTSERTWSMTTAADPFVRKAAFHLLDKCVETGPQIFEPHLLRIGRFFISDALKKDQTGSTPELVKAVTNLTKQYPKVWGTRKLPLERLRYFVGQGSQRSSKDFWYQLDRLLAVLSEQGLQRKTSLEPANRFLEAMRIGTTSRYEPKENAVNAWTCYMNAFGRLKDGCPEESLKIELMRDNIYPLARHYLFQGPEAGSWACPESFICKAWLAAMHASEDQTASALEDEWRQLADDLVSKLASKDGQFVQGLGERWFALAATNLIDARATKVDAASPELDRVRAFLSSCSHNVLLKALHLSRHGYESVGLARLLQTAFEKCPGMVDRDIVAFLLPLDDRSALGRMLRSPCCKHFLSCVRSVGEMEGQEQQFAAMWQALIDQTLADSDLSPEQGAAVLKILLGAASAPALAHAHEALQAFLIASCKVCATRYEQNRRLFKLALEKDALSDEALAILVTDLMRTPAGSDEIAESKRALESILKKKGEILSKNTKVHLGAIQTILAQEQGKTVLSISKSLIESFPGHVRALADTVQQSLETATANSLRIASVADIALVLYKQGGQHLAALLPNNTTWASEVGKFMVTTPDQSLALTSSLGGAYFLAKAPKTGQLSVARCSQGLSVPLRLAAYLAKLVEAGADFSDMPRAYLVELLYLLCITEELLADQLVTAGSDGICIVSSMASPFLEAMSAECRQALYTCLDEDGTLLQSLVELTIQEARIEPLGPKALYSAKLLSKLFQIMVEMHGVPGDGELDAWIQKLDMHKPRPDTIFLAVAFVTGFGACIRHLLSVKTLCKWLASDMVGAFPSSETTLQRLVLLNALLSIYDAGTEIPIDKRNQTVAVKQMATWTNNPPEMVPGLASETCKGLRHLLVRLSDLSGPYWEQAIRFCLWLWAEAPRDGHSGSLCYLQASIKLMVSLEDIDGDQADRSEALQRHRLDISKGLIQLLRQAHDADTPAVRVVKLLLCRRVAMIPQDGIGADFASLLTLLRSDSRDTQTAAYGLIHRAIPAQQEEVALDILLEHKSAVLPAEVLSVLLNANWKDYSESEMGAFPTPIRSFLLSWLLTFETFRAASHRARSDYTEILKKGHYMAPLLGLMFDFLGHQAAQPLALDKAGFTADQLRSYNVKAARGGAEKRDMQWLLAHLFFCVLVYVPGLFRAWFLRCQVKQTKIAVEAWLQKYFSPLVIEDALNEVRSWAERQPVPAEDEQDVFFRINHRAKEVVAGYEIDDEEAAMVIRLPRGYPLENVAVESIRRVAVDEKKWASWLKSTEGIITFSSGNLIDGLVAFRRNVVGALKGQTECAICYSIVSSDKRVPDKRCGTCKNLFHRTCLYKWFQTSNQNTCPLCRNPIEYLGAEATSRRSADVY